MPCGALAKKGRGHGAGEDLIAEGDKVVSRNTVKGTHRGEYLCIAPTGKVVSYDEQRGPRPALLPRARGAGQRPGQLELVGPDCASCRQPGSGKLAHGGQPIFSSTKHPDLGSYHAFQSLPSSGEMYCSDTPYGRQHHHVATRRGLLRGPAGRRFHRSREACSRPPL
ncbi:MAG TPA: ester cyclase [Chloroflexota bacterium]|nr:ester cyclase [Chloroflexota bacterium]